MAQCELLTGGFIAGENNCSQVAAGVYHNRIWLGNLDEITAWAATSTENQYDAITFAATQGLFALKLDKACRVQLYAEWAGGPKLVGNMADSRAKGAWNRREDLYKNLFNYVCRCFQRSRGIDCQPVEPPMDSRQFLPKQSDET